MFWAVPALLWPVPSPAKEAPPQPATNAVAQAKSYMRVAQPDTNTIELQIAMRQFQARDRAGPDIWLVAVSHIGETNYYHALQAFLDAQALVLFEGVGDPADFKTRLQPQKHRPAQEGEQQEPQPASLQSTLAESLGLAFQLDAIAYNRPHFENSDLSMQQIHSLLTQQIRNAQTGEHRGVSNAAFLTLIQAMDGSSWLGTLLHMGAKLLGSNPKLQAMARLMFIEILGQLEGNIAQFQGLPPELKDLLRVLIRERNKVVIRDLKSAINQASPPRSIAVFYGAGHMDDLETQLAAELNCHPVRDNWLSAITVQPARAGLTTAEIGMIRNVIKWQMEILKQELTAAPDPN